MILETHRVNNNNNDNLIDNSIGNEAYVGNDGVPDDDNYGVVYDRTDDTNPHHYHQNQIYRVSTLLIYHPMK